jgi:ribosomal protein S18 acetylase RimI-like enzyme
MALAECILVRTNREIDQARKLILEYAQSLGCSPCLRNLEEEMLGFPHPFAAPIGALLLTLADGAGAGVVGIKKVGEKTAEMTRLYVRPRFRGRHLDRALARCGTEMARQLGYETIRLYTMPSMTVALALYRRLGFEDIAPYGEHHIPGAFYMEKRLGDGPVEEEQMKNSEVCPECQGIGRISNQNCIKCGGSGEVIIHSHRHGHGQTVHDHPHPHAEPHQPLAEDVEHEHAHIA